MTHANPDTPSSPFTSSSAAPARGALGVVDPADLITVAGSLGASHVGLTLLTDTGTVESCWASDDIPVRVDMLQRELDQGPVPCWPAPAHVLVAADLAEDARWPDFAERCISVVGVHSLLCVRIPVASGRLAVLSVCAPQPQAFDDQREKAGQLASLCTDFAEHCDAELAVLSPPPDGAGGGLVATAPRRRDGPLPGGTSRGLPDAQPQCRGPRDQPAGHGPGGGADRPAAGAGDRRCAGRAQGVRVSARP